MPCMRGKGGVEPSVKVGEGAQRLLGHCVVDHVP